MQRVLLLAQVESGGWELSLKVDSVGGGVIKSLGGARGLTVDSRWSLGFILLQSTGLAGGKWIYLWRSHFHKGKTLSRDETKKDWQRMQDTSS